MQLFGRVVMQSGAVSGSRTAVIELQRSSVSFSGNPANPRLDIRGTAQVERTKIHVAVTGSAAEPEIKLSSQPALSEDVLLLMLATNRSWKGAEGLFGTQRISPDLAKDFIDYFVFAGQGSAIARRFGISDISLTYDENVRGIIIKKDVLPSLEAYYGIEQSQKKGEAPDTTHTLGGEYRVTDAVSVSGERSFIQKGADAGTAEGEQSTRDRIFLKYKTQF